MTFFYSHHFPPIALSFSIVKKNGDGREGAEKGNKIFPLFPANGQLRIDPEGLPGEALHNRGGKPRVFPAQSYTNKQW